MVCHSLSKFGIFTCVCYTYNMLHVIFFPLRGGGSDFLIFGGETQKNGGQQSGGTNLGGNYVTLGDPFAKGALYNP